MRAVAVILILLGLGGGAAAGYGHITMTEADDTIVTNTAELRKLFPGAAEQGIDLRSIDDLVAIDHG